MDSSKVRKKSSLDSSKIEDIELIEESIMRKFLTKMYVTLPKEQFNFKNNHTAISFFDKFEYLFDKKHVDREHELLWLFNHRGITLAENDELTRGIVLRIKLLNHLKKYESNLLNCYWGLNIPGRDDFTEILLKNITKCHLHLERPMSKEKRNDIFIRYSGLSFTSQEEKKKSCLEIMKNLQKIAQFQDKSKPVSKKNEKKHFEFVRNDKIPFASESIEVVQDENGKMRVIATRDIQPGEILAVNEKYTKYVNQFLNLLIDCSYCRKFSWAPIPCDKCEELYCSEECKSKDWSKYHRWTCGIIPDTVMIKGQKIKFKFFLDLVEEAGGLDKFVKYFSKGLYKRGLPNPKFDCKKIKSFYNTNNLLEDLNSPLKSKLELKEFSRTYAYYLSTRTNFLGKKFADNNKIFKEKDFIFFSAALFRSCLLLQESIFYYHRYYVNYDKNLFEGFTVYPFVQYFNHNCVANTNYFTSKDHELVIFAKNSIKKGSEVTISYLKTDFYLKIIKPERQSYLKNACVVDCSCEACENDWSMYDLKTIRMLMKNQPESLKILKETCQPLLYDLKERTMTNRGLPFSYIEKIIEMLKIFSNLSLENSIEYEMFSKYLCMAYIAHYGNLCEITPFECSFE